MSPNETMKPDSEWGFTAVPDFPRICRELEQTGAVVGRVAMKGETPVTLIDTRTAKVPGGHASRSVIGAPAHWRVVAGSCEKAALGIRPVTVCAWNKVPVFTTPGVLPDQLARFESLAEGNLDTLWTTGDGSKVRVSAMSDSHLFFALAKAYRNEYFVSADRQKGIEALKLEAARRLLKLRVLTGPTPAPEYSDDPVAIPGRWAVVYRESTGARQLRLSAYAFQNGYASKPEAELARDQIQRDHGHSAISYTVLAPKRPAAPAPRAPAPEYSDSPWALKDRWRIIYLGRPGNTFGRGETSFFARSSGYETKAEAERVLKDHLKEQPSAANFHGLIAPRRP